VRRYLPKDSQSVRLCRRTGYADMPARAYRQYVLARDVEREDPSHLLHERDAQPVTLGVQRA